MILSIFLSISKLNGETKRKTSGMSAATTMNRVKDCSNENNDKDDDDDNDEGEDFCAYELKTRGMK